MRMPRLANHYCDECGKWSYLTRHDAKKVAREAHPESHMDVYRCPNARGYWHYGHMHPSVLEGKPQLARRRS